MNGQNSFQGSMPAQQQNSGQSRGPFPTGPNPTQNSAKPSPQEPDLSLWTLEKPLNAESWDLAVPEKQYLAQNEIQERMARFRRQGEDIAEVLVSLKSPSARRAVNRLVKDENNHLWQRNSTIQYAIASIKLDKEMIKHWPDKGKKRLRRIDVILQTEKRPAVELPKTNNQSLGGTGQGGAQAQKGNNPQGPGAGQGPNGNMQQQQARPMQQGQGQYQSQQNNQYGPQNGQGRPQGPAPGIPPPPPPPPHGPMPQSGGGSLPPPPPPPPPPGQPQYGYPQAARPQQGYPSQPRVQPIEVLDPRVLDAQKARPKGRRHDHRDDTDSDNSDSSASSFESRSVEGGAYGYIERSRSKGRKYNDRSRSGDRKHNNRRRSHSRRRNRSRDRDAIFKSFKDDRIHGRNRADLDSPPRGRLDAGLGRSSPHPPNGGLPSQNIFNIRIDNDNDNERANAKKARDANNRARDPRRSSQSRSPIGSPNSAYRKHDKYAGEPMFRGGSHGSDTTESSFTSSSLYSATSGSVFDEPERMTPKSGQAHMRPQMPRPRDDGFVQPHYNNYERHGKPAYAQPTDYPPHRHRAHSPFYGDHIIRPTSPSWQRPSQAARRHSGQNPFDPRTRYPQRALPYAEPEHHYIPGQPPPRYLTDREHDPMELQDLADAVDYVRSRRKAGRRGSLRTPEVDEWANRAGRYENVHPGYSGYRHV